jgi:hypothetical protein
MRLAGALHWWGMACRRSDLAMRILLGALIGIVVIVVGWYIATSIAAANWNIPGYAWVLMILGSLLAIGLGVGLMTILFYSSRHGDDEAAQYHQQSNQDP